MKTDMSKVDSGYAVTSKEGYLDRYKNFLMGWGTRFVKLDRSYLHHFEAKDSPNPGGSIVRGEVTRCCINHSFKGAAGPYVFDVVCKNGTTWYLRAKTWEEMAEWMLAIHPNSKQELDRVRQGTSNAIFNPGPALPPPLAPQPANPDFGVFAGDPPEKNPNAAPDSSGASSSGWGQNYGHGNDSGWGQNPPAPSNSNANNGCPPSYADLFDKHDPAVQGKR